MITKIPSQHPKYPRGVTLVEMTIAILIGMALSAASMAMLNQQLNITRMVRDQSFILEECPSINNLFSRTLGRVDSYRIYPDVASAKAGGASVLEDGQAMLLTFRDSLNRLQYAIIGAEAQDGGKVRIGYYNRTGGSWGANPDWIISQEATDVVFFLESGVLRIRLTGPNGEEITYSGHTQS